MTAAQMLLRAKESRADAREMLQRARVAHACGHSQFVRVHMACAEVALGVARMWRIEARAKQVRS